MRRNNQLIKSAAYHEASHAVIARVLERAALAAADPELDEARFSAITLSPRNGVRALQTRPPEAR